MAKISVVLPTYNGSKYIKDALESILLQTWEDFELIIVNDCSTDSTLDIISEYAKKDSRIKIITNVKNKKLPASLNIGFKNAMGEYYTWTSDDNLMKPEALEVMCKKLDQSPELGLVYCDMDRIDAEGKLIEAVKWPEANELYKGDCVGACFMYRASVAEKVGEYDENMFLAEDYEYWLRIWKASSIAHIPTNVYQYRIHNASLTGTRQKEIFNQTARLWMKYLDDLLLLIPNYEEKRIFFDRILLSASREEVHTMKKKLCSYSFRYRMRCMKYDMVRFMKKYYHKIKKKWRIFMNRKKLRVGIWGWWEGKNLGDNWIKRTMTEVFPNVEYRTIYENDFSNLDFVICGGGGLFLFDVIEPWTKLDEIKIPFGALGLGAEFPHKSNMAKRMAEKAKFFFVRDDYSVECMGLTKAEKSFDTTFIRPLEWNANEGMNLENVLYVWRDGQEWQHNELFHDYIQLQPGLKPKWDHIVHEHFGMIREDDFSTSDDDIERRMKDIGFVVTGRFHGVVAAIQMGIPFVAIDICPKIRALAKEAGLEKYCVKISEVDRVDDLIRDAKANLSEIREKEYAYRNMAVEKMKKDVGVVYSTILKNCKKVNVLHYGSYWMGENDIVNVMADDLAEVCNVTKIDLKIYSDKPDSRVKVLMREPNTFITILDHKKVTKDVKKYHPDFVVLNAGGLVFEDQTFEYLKKLNIKTIGIELSDPDVFPYNGAIYAHKFDLYYTNAKLSLQTQYDREKVNIGLMPFAASQKHHFYMPEVEKTYDLVVVGHARPDRQEIIDQLRPICKVGTYGNGWDISLGTVNGAEHVKAINTGKMYLSFSKTVAGYNNVKVGLFEAMACKQVVITEYMEELEDYFEIGSEILCFKNVEELKELISYYMAHTDELEQIREKAYDRFLREHTYEKRWIDVLKKVMNNDRIISKK